ncbi:hypothetical protein EV126DRAFT_191031 [Verticillium dahliae]|nr:hypothetical protein EV126DRAFT_189654 [Verticillium dahliae]KAH6704440.1 hypothetical protein EV126DRAFT_191031 [Verticillium dahliae]
MTTGDGLPLPLRYSTKPRGGAYMKTRTQNYLLPTICQDDDESHPEAVDGSLFAANFAQTQEDNSEADAHRRKGVVGARSQRHRQMLRGSCMIMAYSLWLIGTCALLLAVPDLPLSLSHTHTAPLPPPSSSIGPYTPPMSRDSDDGPLRNRVNWMQLGKGLSFCFPEDEGRKKKKL